MLNILIALFASFVAGLALGRGDSIYVSFCIVIVIMNFIAAREWMMGKSTVTILPPKILKGKESKKSFSFFHKGVPMFGYQPEETMPKCKPPKKP